MDKKKILLLGGVLPTLQLLRRLQVFSSDIEVIAHRNDIIAGSRFGTKTLYNSPHEAKMCIDGWIVNKKSMSEEWLIIPCSEFFLGFLSDFTNNGFSIFSMPPSSISTLSDKKKLYELLRSHGVSAGEFYSLDSNVPFESERKYIVKVSRTTPEFQSKFKTAIVSSRSQLLDILLNVPSEFHRYYIVQRLYANAESLSYGGIWMGGKQLSSIVVRQQRQYPIGITSAAKLHDNIADVEYINSVILAISKVHPLNGFVELEFIKCDDELIPIDLNPRLWGWSNLLFYRHPQVLEKIFESSASPSVSEADISSWSNLWRDLPAIMMSRKSFVERLKDLYSLLNTDRVDFICWRDIKPEFISLIRSSG